MHADKLQTIEDYLSLTDWTYVPETYEGVHGEYVWCSSDASFVEIFHNIEVPKAPFKVLVTYWDYRGGAAEQYGNIPGWTVLGDYAVSDVVTAMPEMNYDANNTHFLIDHPLSNQEILNATASFSGFDYCDDNHPGDFWRTADLVRAYCYVANHYGGSTFVARGKELFETTFKLGFQNQVHEYHRDCETKKRATVWERVGPERGPEMCIDSGCDRLRVPLALRCFMHQIKCDWKPFKY